MDPQALSTGDAPPPVPPANAGPPPLPVLPDLQDPPPLPSLQEPLPPPLPEIAREPVRLPFPGIAGALGMMALLLLVQLCIMGAVYLVDVAAKTKLITSAGTLGLVNLVAFAAVCLVVGWRQGEPVWKTLRTPAPEGTFGRGGFFFLLFAIWGSMIASVGWIFGIGGKAIQKSEFMESLKQLTGPQQTWWVVVLVLVVVAPITEETLFRGQFLRAFLGRYSPPVAIGASAVLFSLMHMNPLQLPATLMLGILCGVLYERTRSVWPCIVAHMVNNAIPAGAVIRAGSTAKPTPDFDLSVAACLGMIVAGTLIWLAALTALRRQTPRPAAPAPPPSLEGPAEPLVSSNA